MGGVVLNGALRREVIARTAAQLLVETRMATDLLSTEPDLGGSAQRLATRLGRDLQVRVTVIAADGTVLGDSERTEEERLAMENHATRPEVAAALAGETGQSVRSSATLGIEMLYVAVPIDPQAPARGVVRLATPLTAVARARERERPLIAGTALLSILVAAAAGWLLARQPTRRLQEMSRTASAIAAGGMGARSYPGGDDEVADLARSLNRMAGQMEERLALLERERTELRTILDGMVEGVLLLDADGRIAAANAAFARMFGAGGTLTGRQPLEAARVPALQEAVDRALGATTPLTHEIALAGPPERVISASLAAVREGERSIGAVVVLHDITEIKRLERVRSEFVANVSHELRTPLTAIKGYAETLLAGGLDERPRAVEFVEVIARHADRLRDLIEDLLDLASVEQGEARLRIGRVTLAEVVAQAEATLRPGALRRSQTLRAEIPAGLPAVRADRDRLAQVLINLVDNAIKFTPDGGRIVISAAARDGRVVLSVSDTGIGIPPGELGRIFERFYRVDRSRDRKEGGTGLGLAIAKHLTQAMGGTIEAHSAPGAGTTFQITLPAEA
ncbi:MAG TPA: ATP-binding protein [Patescibacteria group bacterium]|nr:ATP-binding protein [Patescibacteria group bacterium]